MTYFNEIDPFCAQWCRRAFLGEVDERDIRTIERPALAVRQHYFAGIGGWEYALELADWPDDWEVWTGSCPCQPFSVAGKREAHTDERDLWPAFFRLITIGRPAVILGEQVNGAIAFGWLDRVCDDMEGIGYAVGAAVLPACGVAAPHIRSRLYWVGLRLGDADHTSSVRHGGKGRPRLSDTESESYRSAGGSHHEDKSGLGNADRPRLEGYERNGDHGRESGRIDSNQARHAWAASTAIYCADGRWRRIPLEPSFQPLADGGRFGNPRVDSNLSSRIGALKGSGNAIVIPLAAEFIRAVMEALDKRW